MTDLPPPIRPSSPVRKTARRAAEAGVNVIWLVPILALVVTLGVAWKNFAGRGTLIHVAFSDAAGIVPDETQLRFREIAVGKVESVRFSEDLSKVIVDVRVDKDVARFIDDQAEFWIVRPQITARGITRLDTVLTGAFIEGYWDATPSTLTSDFTGLTRAPLTREDAAGTWVVLATDDAEGLSEGAPILYRGLPVGRMENLHVAADGETVQADVFIESPHDQRLTTASVFWDTSGISVGLNTSGVSVNVSSLATLLQGGVQFATFAGGGQPVERGHVFYLNPDEDSARNSVFAGDGVDQARFAILFRDDLRGLERGAEVRFQGLSVGQVTDLSVKVVEATGDQPRQVFQQATIALSPRRLGLPEGATPDDVTAFLQHAVTDGLRAQVAASGFLGTRLVVELVDVADAAPAALDMAGDPYPLIPSVPANLTDLTQTAQGMLSRIGELPIEEVLKSATDMMNSITNLATSQDTRAIPESLRKAIDQTQSTITGLNGVVEEFRAKDGTANLTRLLDEASAAAAALRVAAEGAPEMIDKIDRAATSMDEFAFGEISAQAEGILKDLRAMLGTEDAAQLPRNLSDTLKAASGLLTDLRDGNAAGSLNAALGSAREAADEVAVAVRSLPDLVARLKQTAARAESVLAAYGDRSNFNNEAVSMLRELRRATAAFGSLAQMIERNPRAFILGR